MVRDGVATHCEIRDGVRLRSGLLSGIGPSSQVEGQEIPDLAGFTGFLVLPRSASGKWGSLRAEIRYDLMI